MDLSWISSEPEVDGFLRWYTFQPPPGTLLVRRLHFRSFQGITETQYPSKVGKLNIDGRRTPELMDSLTA